MFHSHNRQVFDVMNRVYNCRAVARNCENSKRTRGVNNFQPLKFVIVGWLLC